MHLRAPHRTAATYTTVQWYHTSTVVTFIPGHWFLHVARFSSGAHSEGELLVGAGRGGHVHGIDVWVVEQLVELGVELRDAVSLGEVFRGAFRPPL